MGKKRNHRLLIGAFGIMAAVLVLVIVLIMENRRGYLFQNLDAEQIERVEYSYDPGTAGTESSGQGEMAFRRIPEFVEFLKKIRLGGAMPDGESASSGASSIYMIVMKDGSQLKLKPGRYFGVDGVYYRFVNFDELWDEFVEWNSSL